MAAYGGSFESANSIEVRKEFKRKSRQDAIEKAKQKYEEEERKKELRKARGEDTWMLPEVNQRLQTLEEEHLGKKKKKKEKKSKKSKKEKKKKAKKERKGDEASDSSEDSGEEWVEAQPQMESGKQAWKIPEEEKPASTATDSSQRDEWMTFDFLAMKTTSTTERRAAKEREKEAEQEKARAIEQAGLHKLELNPYWRDGGSGLPPEERAGTTVKKVAVVDDGGLSWLRRAFQRMREQAQREQRSLEEVVAERYGSMERFQKRLQEAEEAAYGGSRGGGRGGRGQGGERWRRGPQQNSSHTPSPISGRDYDYEREGKRDRERYREDGRDWESPREESRDRERDWEERRDRERHREEREDRERDREERRDRDREERRDRDREQRRDRDREEPRDRDWEERRDRERDREERRDGEHQREDGRYQRDWRREGASGRDRDDHGEGRDTRSRERSSRAQEDHSPPQRESCRPGQPRGQQPLSSLKSRFLKPSDTDASEKVSSWARKAATLPTLNASTTGFQKPRDDDDDDDDDNHAPAWRKSSHTRGGHDKQEMEIENRKQTQPIQPAEQMESSAALVERSSGNKPNETPPSSESEEEEEEEELLMLTDEEMNKLGAKLVKAELMGNAALVDKLKAQLEAARRAKENRTQKLATAPRPTHAPNKVTAGVEEDQEVLLFRTDQSGRAWPVNAPTQPVEPKGGRRKRKAIETHEAGERVRYFEDDDGTELRDMVRREKMSSAADQNALYARMAAKMMGKQDGDNYTLDDMFVSSAAQRERAGQDEERQRSRAVEETRRLAGRMDKCPRCFDSAELPKHLIVAIGAKVYLCLPNCVSLTEGHCLIAPLQHHCCATGLDEDIWAEIQMFRRALVKMFEKQDLDCVFLETHMNPAKRLHMVYECVPLPRELGDMAPLYFKKAIMEADEEWAMNKKVVDLSSKSIRQAVPRGLPYFSVDFGLQGGYAHVIENHHKFPHYFGKEIIGGMMDLEPRRWRKPIRENFDDQRKKVLQFSQWWKPFDCTKATT